MIEITPTSNELIIGEEHLYTIMFGLEDALKIYKFEVNKYNKINYAEMSCKEIHLMKWFEGKVFDTEKLLKEINKAIENIEE